MKSSRKVMTLSILALLLLGIFLAYLYSSIPKKAIHDLQKGYVVVILNDKKPQYKIVQRKPLGWLEVKDIPTETKTNKTGMSQKLTRSLFFNRDEGLILKAKLLLSTSYLEKNISQSKILETYLNVAHFGNNIYGISAAAKYYFKKKPSQLNSEEAALFGLLLLDPQRHAEFFQKKKLTPKAKTAIKEVLGQNEKSETLNKNIIKKKSAPQAVKSVPRQKALSGTQKAKKYNEEQNYQIDPDLIIDEEIEFDADAIPEDAEGLEEEFQAE